MSKIFGPWVLIKNAVPMSVTDFVGEPVASGIVDIDDGNLIATAPEMLAMLEIVGFYVRNLNNPELSDAIKTVIKKARGEK